MFAFSLTTWKVDLRMVSTNEDNILAKVLRQDKGYSAKKF